MKHLAIATIFSLFISCSPKPAREVASSRSIVDWILSAQVKDGGMVLHPVIPTKGAQVTPYFSNLAFINLLKVEDIEIQEEVKKYIHWYLSHVNTSDKYGATGTIYDFTYRQGIYHPTYAYDSSDAYAGSFLSLVYHYHRVYKDDEFIRKYLPKFFTVSKAIEEVYHPEHHLTGTLPKGHPPKEGIDYYKVLYFMDNVEVYSTRFWWG